MTGGLYKGFSFKLWPVGGEEIQCVKSTGSELRVVTGGPHVPHLGFRHERDSCLVGHLLTPQPPFPSHPTLESPTSSSLTTDSGCV